ncbi:MAG TPA: glycosyltransferase, partial [Polyangiaceae bacterium]|nr:glycosyltransferase [Polyangiaceae bacterium]
MKTVLVDLSALDTSLRLRGIGRHVQLLASGLSRLVQSDDCGLRIIGLVHLSPFANDNALHDLQHIEFDPMPPRASLLDDQKTQWFRRLILQRAAKNARADLIHLPDPNAPPLRFTRSPLQLVTCHDLATVRSNRPWLRFTTSVHKRLMAHRYLSADHIISISSYTAEDLRTLFGLPSSRISTVYNGIDSNRWSSEKNEEDARICQKYGISNTPFALYVGHASWRKNQSGMLRALRYARELKPDLGLQLVWAGRLSVDEFSAIDREARNLGIRHALRLLNFVSDEELACLYRCAAAHLLVSRHEGFGLTVVEA